MTKGNDRDCVPRPISFDLQSRYCAAGIEDALASGTAPRVFVVLAGRCFDLQSAYQATLGDQTAFGLYLLLFYKEAALFLGLFFWLHQWGIPHRMCRFYCCLAAHQRTKEKDSAEPLSSILWTPPPHPREIRCGGALLLPRVWGNIGSLYPVLSLLPSSEFYLAFCVRAGLARVSVGLLGLYRLFFIIGGRGCLCLRLRWVWLWSIVGFALTAIGSIVLADKRYGISCIVRGLACMGYLFS